MTLGISETVSSHTCDASTFQLASDLHRMFVTDCHPRDIRANVTMAQLEEVERCFSAIPAVLKYVQNSLSPINALPVELLSYIFGLVAEHRPTFPHTYITHLDPIYGLRMTHVCRHWRNVALVFPVLWTTVDTARPMAVNDMLHRTNGAPLTVIMRDRICEERVVPCLEDTGVLVDIAHQSHQIQELHIEPIFSYGNMLLEQFNQPAPNLRALTIHNRDVQRPHGTVLLPRLFDDCTPRLERLTLDGYVHWPYNDFNNLTHLCLRSFITWPAPLLLSTLHQCPNMQHLALVTSVSMTPQNLVVTISGPPCYPVSLPRLRTLDLGCLGSRQNIWTLLSHLLLPPSTAVNLWAPAFARFFCDSDGDKLATFIPADIVGLGPLTTVHAIHIMDHKHAKQHGGLGDELVGNYVTDVLSIHEGVLHLVSDFPSQDVLPSLLAMLHTQEIREITLALQSDRALSANSWRSLMKQVDGLTMLTILGKSSNALLALRTSGICPHLAELSVEEERRCTGFLLQNVVSQRAYEERFLTKLRVLKGGFESPESRQLDDYNARQLRECVAKLEYKTIAVHESAPKAWPSDAYRWEAARRSGK